MSLFAIKFPNKLSFISNISLMLTKNISFSPISRLKQIRYSEKDNTITVEAVRVKSEITDKLVPNTTGAHKDCCPLCRLNLRRLAYTDVLILRQFVQSDGTPIPQSITGLCNRMNKKVYYLVKKAQRCQLMPRPANYVSYGPWHELNTYYEWPQRVRDQPIKIIEPKYWTSDYYQNKL